MFDLPPVSRALDDAIRRTIDSKTKPHGALGSIETLAEQIARIQGTLTPSLHRCRLTLFAGDHGIAHAGVSAYPQAVTRQMVANFLAGGAAANVFARANGVDLRVVDAGVAGGPIDAPELISRRIAAGTKSSAVEAAMTADECEAALRAGDELGTRVDADAAAFGEMGIANTSSATLVGTSSPRGSTRYRPGPDRRRRARTQERGPRGPRRDRRRLDGRAALRGVCGSRS